MSRPSIDETWMNVAVELSRRGTCIKKRCGCVLTDARGRLIGHGWNGVASGLPHCNHLRSDLLMLTDEEVREAPEALDMAAWLVKKHLPRAKISKARFYCKVKGGHRIEYVEHPHSCEGVKDAPGAETCQAVHAEVNALIKCREPDAIHTLYSTDEPCFRCTKDMANTGCRRVVFMHSYGPEPQAAALWRKLGREWVQF